MPRSRPSRTTEAPAEGQSEASAAPNKEPASELAERAAEIIERVRRDAPRVHCITNAVAQTFSANMLLAAGAVPSMTIAADEVADFVGGAGALLVNLGTLDPQRREAIYVAVHKAGEKDIPWLLDPVFVDRSPHRVAYARELAGRKPAGIRLNRGEFGALAAAAADPEHLTLYARHVGAVVGLTGDVDLVGDGERVARIENGHALMGRVTAMGCAGSALVAACLAVERDAFVAITAGLIALGVAGEIAGRRAKGPGSFAAAILDAVYALDAKTLRTTAKVA